MAKSRPSSSVLPVYDPVGAGFLDARGKLIDIAAFLDRAERREKLADYRVRALQGALKKLSAHKKGSNRAAEILDAFSDPTSAPVHLAGSSASGAWKK